MSILSISLEQTANVPKSVLFNLLADHANLGRFFNADISLIRQGKPDTNGIGAVREVTAGPFTYHEQIIGFKENEHLHYKIIDGAPVKEYGGWIRFENLNARQSLVHYHINFSPKFVGTGWLIKYFMTRQLRQALQHIAQYGENKCKH